jgi:hypothetical protein
VEHDGASGGCRPNNDQDARIESYETRYRLSPLDCAERLDVSRHANNRRLGRRENQADCGLRVDGYESAFRPISRTRSRCGNDAKRYMLDTDRNCRERDYGGGRSFDGRDDWHARRDAAISPRRGTDFYEVETTELRHPARDRTMGGRDQWSADYLHSPRRDRAPIQRTLHDGTADAHVYGRVRYNRQATPDGSRESGGRELDGYDEGYYGRRRFQDSNRSSPLDARTAPSKWMKPPTFNGQVNVNNF